MDKTVANSTGSCPRNVIRLDDGLVMDWSTMEKTLFDVKSIVPYRGQCSPGASDLSFVSQWYSNRHVSEVEQACMMGWLASELGKPGIAAIIWHVVGLAKAAQREQMGCYADKMRLDFLANGAELTYCLPTYLTVQDGTIREQIWTRPWVCQRIGGPAMSGDSARAVIDAVMNFAAQANI